MRKKQLIQQLQERNRQLIEQRVAGHYVLEVKDRDKSPDEDLLITATFGMTHSFIYQPLHEPFPYEIGIYWHPPTLEDDNDPTTT